MRKVVVAAFPLSNEEGSVSSTASVLLRDGKAEEFFLQSAKPSVSPGDIYIGKIEKIQRNLKAAFVRFTSGENGYLPLSDEDMQTRKAGDELAVQVEKEALKGKLPRLTTNLKVKGNLLILTSERQTLNYSRKLQPDERERIRSVLEGQEISFGVLVRTRASSASGEALLEELAALQKEMNAILRKAGTRTCYSCIYRAESIWQRMLRESVPGETGRLVTDIPSVYEEMCVYVKDHESMLFPEPELYEDDLLPLYKLYNLSAVLAEASSKKVWLRSGGFLLIEETAAFTAVDVNSGRYQGKRQKDETAAVTNREAANEVIRQIHLRQLSGTILVDFIDLDARKKEEAEKSDLLTRMQQLASGDSTIRVIDVTPLGIMELTRTKVWKPLSEQIQACLKEKNT